MLSYRDFITAFRDLDLGSHSRVIIHASLSSFGPVVGGAETIVGALTSTCGTIIAPAFTFKTMITPLVGPSDNAMIYGSADDQNRLAEIFHLDMPVDPSIGVIAESLRHHPKAQRSNHPILSFTGINADEALEAQTLEDPWAPIGWLSEYDGDVLLLGVDHTVNTSLHYAEMKAERLQFTRWALTAQGIATCSLWPGCPRGFQAIAERLDGISRKLTLGSASVEAVPLRDLVNIVVGWIHQDPRALLCDRLGCDYCSVVRAAVRETP